MSDTMTDAERKAFFDALTPDMVEKAIAAALRAHDIEAVPGLLHILAVKAPDRAQLHLDALELARTLREDDA